MRIPTLLFSSLLFLFFAASCKRNPFDASQYEDLLYRKVIAPAPTKEYIFKANVNGKEWSATGFALVSGDTMTVSGTVGDQTLLLKFVGFKTNTTFVLRHAQDSAALITNGRAYFDYASIGNSEGTITIKKLDEGYNQIEANFNAELYSTSGDKINISNGYFKINYTSNDIRWTENSKVYVADSVWALDIDTRYEVYGLDTSSKRMIKLLIPKSPLSGIGETGMPVNSLENLPAAYYSVANDNPLKASSGSLQFKSNVGNVVKGTFGVVGTSMKFGTGTRTYFVTKGTYSASY